MSYTAHEPYTAEISRTNPTCFLFLVDQSGSMGERWGTDQTTPKAQGVADAINRLIYALVDRCSKDPETIYDYYSIGVIGYGGDQRDPACVSLGFAGDALAGGVLQPVSQIALNPLRVDQRSRKVPDGAGGLIEQVFDFPVWLDPLAAGQTPMCRALGAACEQIVEFVGRHPDCFPPIVFNITDGAANDGDPEPWAAQLRNVASSNGNVLLMNVHISKQCGNPVFLPASEIGLPDENARRLFRMSSVLPPKLLDVARTEELLLPEGARGFAFNADVVSVIRLIDIGTRLRPTGR